MKILLAAALFAGSLAPSLVRAGEVHMVTPCRLFDTRDDVVGQFDPSGPVTDGQVRRFWVQGKCGVGLGATGVFVTVTITEPTARGHLVLCASRTPYDECPPVSTAAWNEVDTYSTFALVQLGCPRYSFFQDMQLRAKIPYGSVHVIVDVLGYVL